MPTLRAKVTSKGQVTLPKFLRDKLSIREGDQVEFSMEPNLEVKLVKLHPSGSSAGILRHLAGNKPVTLAEMDKAVAEAMGKKYGRKN